MKRIAELKRKTKETEITCKVNLDGKGIYKVHTGIGFLDHMMEQLSKHSGIDININASSMEKYGLGINSVLDSFKKYNNLISAGKITNNNSDYSVKIKSLYKSAEELSRLPIKSSSNKTIYLSDIASVKQTFDKNKDYVNINGNPGILLQINKKENSSTITLYDSIKNKLAELDGTINPLSLIHI